MTPNQILVATNDNYAQVRIVGRGSFECSQSLRDFCVKILETKISKLIIDLSECVSMDSTFMGVLGMIGVRARGKSLAVEIVNINEANRKLLKGLGLHKIFHFSQSRNKQIDWISLCCAREESSDSKSKLDKTKTMLEAHETLVDISPENIPKFKDVIEYLKEDIKTLSNQKGTAKS